MLKKINFAVTWMGIGFLIGAAYCALVPKPLHFGLPKPIPAYGAAICCALVGIGFLLARHAIATGFLRAMTKTQYWAGTVLSVGLAGSMEACMHATGMPHPEGFGVPFAAALAAWITARWGRRKKL